jgi:hypothetical protein
MLHEQPTQIAYYGDSNSCIKVKMHPIDWVAAQRSPDKSKWALSAQSGTVVDRSRPIYAIGAPQNTNAVYPWPRDGR